jgi:hypothetical protein
MNGRITRPWPRAIAVLARLRGPVLLGLTVGGALAVVVSSLVSPDGLAGYDIHAYWVVDAADPYRIHVAPMPDAFLYSPPIAFLFDPLGALPFDVVRVAWAALQGVVLAILAGPLAALMGVIGPVRDDALTGNVALLMGACIALGITRWPAAWAFPILAKATPVVGLAWYVGRGDARGLAIAAGTTGAIAAVTFVVAPGLWLDWIGVLRDNEDVRTQFDLGPLPLRMGLAGVACWWAGRRGRAWVVPIAVAVSAGHVWMGSLAVGVAAIALWRRTARLPKTVPQSMRVTMTRWVEAA